MSERIYGWVIAIILFAIVGAGVISMAAQEIERDRACRDLGGVMVKPWNSQPVCVAAPLPPKKERCDGYNNQALRHEPNAARVQPVRPGI